MTDITCKCGASRLEDVQCAECGAYFKAGWIPVSERLPEHAGTYLCIYKSGFYTLGEWLLTMWEIKGFLNDVDIVTHWMPLPEPPESS